jgi:hypothetical protein
MKTSLKTKMTAAVVLGFWAFLPNAQAQAQTQTSCGNLPKAEIAQSDVNQTLDEITGFTDVTGSVMNFVVGGNSNTCVSVNFSVQVVVQGIDSNNPDDDLVIVFASALDSINSVDGPVQFLALQANVPPNVYIGVLSYNFTFPSVAPGPHTIRMRVKPNIATAGGNRIGEFAMVVRHR